MLHELLALGGEGALLLGAQVDALGRGRGGHPAGCGAALRVLAARPGEGRETRVDLVQAPCGGAQIALEGVAPQRGSGREGVRIPTGRGPVRRVVRRVVRQVRGRPLGGRLVRHGRRVVAFGIHVRVMHVSGAVRPAVDVA